MGVGSPKKPHRLQVEEPTAAGPGRLVDVPTGGIIERNRIAVTAEHRKGNGIIRRLGVRLCPTLDGEGGAMLAIGLHRIQFQMIGNEHVAVIRFRSAIDCNRIGCHARQP